MATAIRRINHHERLSYVGHLEELRARLIVSVAAVAVCFGFCLWQNHALLKLINAPLAAQTQKQVRAGHGPLGATYRVQLGARDVARQLDRAISAFESPGSGASAKTKATLAGIGSKLHGDVRRLSAPPEGEKPVTLGIGEPLTTTIGVTLLFALILAGPVLLYELYAFITPALEAEQQRAARPLLLAVPLLFLAGVLFGYEIVLPRAVSFLANFNSGQFNTLVQASPYYHFAATTLLAMGLVFQVPVGVLVLTKTGVLTVEQLRHGRRYAILICAAVAALLPSDLITMLLEAVPLYLLFELGLAIAGVTQRRQQRHANDGKARLRE